MRVISVDLRKGVFVDYHLDRIGALIESRRSEAAHSGFVRRRCDSRELSVGRDTKTGRELVYRISFYHSWPVLCPQEVKRGITHQRQ